MSERISYPFGPGVEVRTAAARDQSPEGLVLSQWPELYFRPDFAPREQFSASQVETSLSCESAWGFRYLWGLKTLEFSWAEVLAGQGTSRDKSTAFGKAMHTEGERYYTTGTYDSDSAPGRALTAGLHLLPHPTQCEVIEVELGIDIDMRYIAGGADPVKFVGFKDLVTRFQGGEWFLFDYKSTKDFDYKKDVEDRRSKRGFIIHGLRDDLAANTYALDVMLRIGSDSLRGRWVYFKSQGRPEAQPTDISWTKSHAKDVFYSGVIQATHLRNLMRAKVSPFELDANPDHCEAFGGCPYRASKGGPCTKEKSKEQFLLGSAIENTERKRLPTIGGFQEGTNNMSTPQQPNESVVQYKIRCAREAAALATGQAPAPAQQAPQAQPGFAPPPPGGFIQPPVAQALPPALQPQQFAPAPAQPPAFAPPPQFAAPPGPALAPVQSHVLPPEAAQAPPAPQLPPAGPAGPAPAVAPPAEAKRRGRKPGSKNVAGSTQTQGGSEVTCSAVAAFEFGDATITIEAGSFDDAQSLAQIFQAALS